MLYSPKVLIKVYVLYFLEDFRVEFINKFYGMSTKLQIQNYQMHTQYCGYYRVLCCPTNSNSHRTTPRWKIIHQNENLLQQHGMTRVALQSVMQNDKKCLI